MSKEERIREIKAEMSRLGSELRSLSHAQIKIKEKLTYPVINFKGIIEDRYIDTAKMVDTIRLVLTPEWQKHARLSVLLESEEVSKIQEALSFLKSCGWLKSESLIYYSPKMSRAFSATRGGEHSELSSERWMNWGTMSNGRYVTAKTSECPRTGKECLLSDILEDEVSEKYFLSETAIKRLITYKDKKLEPLQQGRAKGQQSEHMLLKINSMRKLNK